MEHAYRRIAREQPPDSSGDHAQMVRVARDVPVESLIVRLVLCIFLLAIMGALTPQGPQSLGLYRWAIYPVPFHKPHHPHAQMDA